MTGPLVVSDATFGCSIAVSGVCPTVTEFDDDSFTADVMAETLDHTTLGAVVPGASVNLERAILQTPDWGAISSPATSTVLRQW